jgi:hypothetical protein
LHREVGVSILSASAVEVGVEDEQQIPFGTDNKKNNDNKKIYSRISDERAIPCFSK